MKKWLCRNGEELVMGTNKEPGQVVPPGLRVQSLQMISSKTGSTFRQCQNDIPYKVPSESREGTQVGLQLALLPKALHAKQGISGHTAWLPEADGYDKAQYTVVAEVEIRDCSIYPDCQYLEWGK